MVCAIAEQVIFGNITNLQRMNTYHNIYGSHEIMLNLNRDKNVVRLGITVIALVLIDSKEKSERIKTLIIIIIIIILSIRPINQGGEMS